MPGARRPRRGSKPQPAGEPSGGGQAPAGGLEPVWLSESERLLIESLRRGGAGVARETALQPYGGRGAAAPARVPEPAGRALHGYGAAKREWGAGESLRPEQHMVMGDYYRARRGFGSDAELARMLGVHRSRVTGWKQGELPDRENARLLASLGVVVAELLRFMDPEVVPDWLGTGQVEAGGREPIALLREGKLAEVLLLANATEFGAYV